MKKILLALGFLASVSGSIAKAQSCAASNPAGPSANANYSGTLAQTTNTACLTLSCSAAISRLTPKFELVFVDGAAGPGLPGAHYANDPAGSDPNQAASFQLDSTCNAKIVATITSFADSASTPHTISTTPVVGIDSSSYVTDASTYQATTGSESALHKIVADVALPDTLAGLPAGEYDATITLNLTAAP